MSDPSTIAEPTARIEVFDHPALLNACMQDWLSIGLELATESLSQYQTELHCAREESKDGKYSTLYELRVKKVSAEGVSVKTFGLLLAVKEVDECSEQF